LIQELIFTSKPHPGSGDDRSTLIDDRSVDASGQLPAGQLFAG
jgi:hypothetical protein